MKYLTEKPPCVQAPLSPVRIIFRVPCGLCSLRSGELHGLASMISFLAMIEAMPVLSKGFEIDARWRALAIRRLVNLRTLQACAPHIEDTFEPFFGGQDTQRRDADSGVLEVRQGRQKGIRFSVTGVFFPIQIPTPSSFFNGVFFQSGFSSPRVRRG